MDHQQGTAPQSDVVAGPLLLGLDLGTSSLKCGLFDLDGHRVAAARVPCALRHVESGGEQDAFDWWEALLKAIRLITSKVQSSGIAAIAVGGHAPSPVFVDKNLDPVSPVVPWLDQRAKPQAERIVEALGRGPSNGPERLLIQVAARAMWLRDNGPDRFEQVDCVLQSGDYLVARLTGQRIITSAKVPEVLSAANLPPGILPAVEMPPGSKVGPVLPGIANDLGLSRDVSVVTAGLDSFLASVGAGVSDPGDACLMSGSSAGVALAATERCKGRFQWGEKQLLSRPVQIGGRALDWVHQAACHKSPLSVLLIAATERKHSSSNYGLVTDLLEQSTLGDAFVRKLLSELVGQHDAVEILRAVLDAIFLSQRDLLGELEREGGPARRIRAVGGLAGYPQLVQLQSDILGQPVEVPAIVESGTLGAAMCAAVALGFGGCREASLRMVRVNHRCYPQREVSADYGHFTHDVPSVSVH